MDTDYQVDNQVLTGFLTGLLNGQLPDPARQWLWQKLGLLKQDPQAKDLYLTFSAVPRFLGKDPLELTDEDLNRADQLRRGFNLEGWSVPQTARVLVVCAYPYHSSESFLKIIDQIFGSAEVSELVALYSALPLYPYPDQLRARASEGIRTNMSVVFDAVVLNNPYPCEYLEASAWNQMVLKALFMERPLFKIYGLESRSNLELSKMISNYAHERWVAGRPTSPEMWRAVGNQGTISIYQDLEHLLTMNDHDQQAAAVLTARALNTRESHALLDQHQPAVEQVDSSNTTWDEIGKRWWLKQTEDN